MKIVACRVPLRISFAGGGTDVEPFVSRYGSAVIATTINLYVESKLTANSSQGVRIHSIDTKKNFYISEGQPDSSLLDSILTACLTKIPPNKRTVFTCASKIRAGCIKRNYSLNTWSSLLPSRNCIQFSEHCY